MNKNTDKYRSLKNRITNILDDKGYKYLGNGIYSKDKVLVNVIEKELRIMCTNPVDGSITHSEHYLLSNIIVCGNVVSVIRYDKRYVITL